MTPPSGPALEDLIEYPTSDGKRVAENTLQYQWIVMIQGGLDDLYVRDLNVFVAADLLWYPLRGHPEICAAPDTLVVFGRRKGYRGSYRQWEEGGQAPQVVFEVLSPNNTREEMDHKFDFYEHYGIEEYYIYDPNTALLTGYLRDAEQLRPIAEMSGWVSPRLRVTFDLSGNELVIVGPDGQRFLTYLEQAEKRRQAELKAENEARQRVEAERQAAQLRLQRDEARREGKEAATRAEEAQHRVEEAQKQAEEERLRAERFAAKLREAGLDPEA